MSEDQRYLLTSCCDENGELLESTSILIQVDERDRRKSNQHSRRLALRKLWEFIIVLISQTCKPWRIVIGRLGRIGHSELRGWGCLLSKKNLQRVCNELKEQCEACNVFGNMEMPSILSACLISMESCDNICIYPESFSREDKLAAAALNGQQLSANHLAQSYGVSCTHILTFPASAIIQPPHSSSIINSFHHLLRITNLLLENLREFKNHGILRSICNVDLLFEEKLNEFKDLSQRVEK